MSIKLEVLRCFCVVAEAGNLADAAARLGRTQSALSMTLKQLEEGLGRSLFEGERKRALTPFGKQVLKLGQAQLRQYDTTVDAIERLAQSPQGVLQVSSVPSVAAMAFPPLVRHMAKNRPDLTIELRDSDTERVLDALAQGWADIGIASVKQSINGIDVEPLFSDPFGLVISTEHPLARQAAPITLEDVISAEFLRNGLCDQITSPDAVEALGATGVTVHNTQSLLAMVRAGEWVTILPASTLRLAGEGLAFRGIAGLPDMRHVFLYSRQNPSSPDAVSEAAEVIRALDWGVSDMPHA